MAIAFVGGFCQQVPETISMRTYMEIHAVLEEAVQAASASEIDFDRVGQAGLTLSVEDLARKKQLTAHTRSWLARSSIHMDPQEFTYPRPIRGLPLQPIYHYHSVMSVNLEGAWSCDIALPKQPYLLIYCQSPSGTVGFPFIRPNER
jgi:hypothetical protein